MIFTFLQAKRTLSIGWGMAVLMLWLMGCQATAVSPVVEEQAAAAVLPTPTLRPALAQPVVEYSEPAQAAEMPSFSLGEGDDASADAAASEVVVLTAVPTSTPSPIPPTAVPSPTPPHLRYTSPDEHYWFWRPIREGETNWTNKTYPYGSTRGGTLRPHHGVEFDVPTGSEVIAVADGTVRYAGSDAEQIFGPEANFYGNLVVIEHDAQLDGQPVFSLYAHLSEPWVQEGQHVFMQQVIGLSGATGVADGSHLHFEVRVGENTYTSTRNPLLWLYPFPDRGTVVGQVFNLAGERLDEVVVTLSPIGGGNRSHTTITYAAGDVNSDLLWQENFAIDDVGAGSYKATVQIGDERVTQEILVRPYHTTYVELIIDPPPPTPTVEPTP